ncbi:Fic family protein [Algoriphagus boseongensis]|uniref:Fic family protein n=1 Tax=Algoriphagus boseongensis TaxID=1442587 RepID=A0A4R6T8H4_9BACT|nr:Fic family protein [Algoriphagus boseongensis]TDQ17565.1 Fic family protein [Algoriphagus boseongensis]
MKPPYDITPEILKWVSSISEKIGEANALFLSKPSPQLRKQNQIKTIHSSLQIEGNTLSEDQITALLEDKRVIGPKKDILEVFNAVSIYEKLDSLKSISEKSFLSAHATLMNGLIEHPGKYRTRGVGVVKGSQVTHLAPPAENVPGLMKDLFRFLKNDQELVLIKSCVFHYEMEFIHPFLDGNGRMGRLWQTVILKEKYPVFESLPFETLINRTQSEYYEALALSDKMGNSTVFIEYMLRILDAALEDLLRVKGITINPEDRMTYFLSLGKSQFTRKDYMEVFKTISTATASRDLKKAVENGVLKAEGVRNQTWYSIG